MEAKWTALAAEGKKIMLKGREGPWMVFECKSDEAAIRIVRELQIWSKADRESMEFQSLC